MSAKAKFRADNSVCYGKRLPGAIYLFRPRQEDVPPELWATIRRAEIAAQPDSSWNLLKVHTDQFALTFLSYPDFDTEPHPALADATKLPWGFYFTAFSNACQSQRQIGFACTIVASDQVVVDLDADFARGDFGDAVGSRE